MKDELCHDVRQLNFFRLSTFDFPLNAPNQVYEMTPQLAIYALVMSYGDDFAIVP